MTVVHSVGVTALIALMSAGRLKTAAEPLDRETVEAIECYLRNWNVQQRANRPTEPPPSYN